MKILHIGTRANDGAGLGMMRLHHDLQMAGIDSRVLCLSYNENDSDVFGFLSDPRIKGRRERRPVRSVLRRLGVYQDEQTRGERMVSILRQMYPNIVFSTPFSRYRLDKSDLVNDADIIHLHWTSRFLDWPTFFRHVRKPIVWTLRDENPALGFWHYRTDMPETLPPELKAGDNWIRNRKEDILQSCQSLSIVSLSTGEDSFFARSSAFARRRHLVIPNSVDETIFIRDGGQSIRMELGIPPDAKVISFVAQTLADPRKGFLDFDQALACLNDPNIVVLCAGRGPLPQTSAPVRYVPLGLVTDPKRLAAVFSASNLFVSPSRAETFGKTATEALGCGTPVVSYPNAGAKDIVGPDDGVLTDGFTTNALHRAIQECLARTFDADQLRTRVVSRFSPTSVAKAYINLYRSISMTSEDKHNPLMPGQT